MSTELNDLFENNELNGPYKVSEVPELLSRIDAFLGSCNLTEKGRSIRMGQLTSKLTKCMSANWPGLDMVEAKFKDIDIYIERSDEVLNVKPMIIDTEGDAYDLDEASGKIDFMIPKAEILRRAAQVRDNQNFDL